MKNIARSAMLEEFESAVSLINNVFRISRNENPTMVEEFPLLLNKRNINNMIVVVDNDKVVTDINYLIQDVSIEGNIIKAASIGGVCSDPRYEGRGYASKALDFVEEKMKSDGVDVLCISGTRTLYTRRKCSKVKSFYKYMINQSSDDISGKYNLKIRDFEESDLEESINLYNQNSTRFIRTKESFKILLNSATIPWGNFSYKKLSITKDDKFLGYVVVRIVDDNPIFGKIIELSLDKMYVGQVFKMINKKYSLNYIIYHVHIKDYKNQLDEYDKKELDYQGGTLKVINFEKLMNNLKYYFNQYVESELLNDIKFSQTNHNYVIEYKKEERLVFNDADKLNKFLFGFNENNYDELKSYKNIQKFAKSVLPLDFVWTENLNYQ